MPLEPTRSSFNVIRYSALDPSWVNMACTAASEQGLDLVSFREYCAWAKKEFTEGQRYAPFHRGGPLELVRAKAASDLADELGDVIYASTGLEKKLRPTTAVVPKGATFVRVGQMYKNLKLLMEAIDRLVLEELSMGYAQKHLKTITDETSDRVVDAILARVSYLEGRIAGLKTTRQNLITTVLNYVRG